ncbi:hypothetical protein BVC93_18285 [Mycobacterium sp. MS1601]|uniref:DUF3159 domain-containing protein n=1 Tax=Mycobacterium sp. MS1601 TaxID=1936029 RepID=UPI0009793B8F|nr:DUF3159 domain-containing protein [Mycobacterium sp. MS1601]AQA04052.1 hypothetical protein BVC93_18285 [Mycobacterium sp. MS1601]
MTQQPDAPAQLLLNRMGGPWGIVAAIAPVVVFAAMSGLGELIPALAAALLVAAAIALYRVLRGQRLFSATAGFLGVAVAASVSIITGEGRDFYVIGIWHSLLNCVVLVISVLVRRPLAGYLWAWGAGAAGGWRTNPRARTAFAVVTVCWAAVFGLRFAVQQHLYVADETMLLGIARIGMGLPLTALALLFSVWATRSARADLHRLPSPAWPPRSSSLAH